MKKIMFNDKYCLTQAVLNGRKTMTRRIERFVPPDMNYDNIAHVEGGLDDKGQWIFTLYNENGDIIGDIIPRYNIGEVVAIAQSYKAIYDELEYRDGSCVANEWWCNAWDIIGGNIDTSSGYTNKIFVKAALMKHHINITDVKIERLQDIPEEEILKEGVWQFYDNEKIFYISKNEGASTIAFLTAREAFEYLIDKVSGKDVWERNPWVVAYSFEKVD